MSWWRELAEKWSGGDPEAIPRNPELGTRYPWRAVLAHGHSRALQYRVDQALRVLDQAAATGADWRVFTSFGKDSSALAFLCQIHGAGWRAVTVSDDLSMPGEDAWIEHLAAHLGLPLERIGPEVSIRQIVESGAVDLTGDLHTEVSPLAQAAFYAPLQAHRSAHGYNGVVWGLRAEESRGRKMGRRANGLLYQREDGLCRASPLGDWSSLDVHAFLLRHKIPLAPVYLCVDPGADPYRIRTDWFFAGGDSARLFGHYTWLRRWWPSLYDWCAKVSPSVRALG